MRTSVLPYRIDVWRSILRYGHCGASQPSVKGALDIGELVHSWKVLTRVTEVKSR